jgi:hypothetical protein
MKLTIERMPEASTYGVEMDDCDDSGATVLAAVALATLAHRNNWSVEKTLYGVRSVMQTVLENVESLTRVH